jgi:hypothetical protein
MTDAQFLKNFVFEAHALYHIDDAALNEIKAIAKRLEDDEWRPIETAPKDGKYNCSAGGTHWKPLSKEPL